MLIILDIERSIQLSFLMDTVFLWWNYTIGDIILGWKGPFEELSIMMVMQKNIRTKIG